MAQCRNIDLIKLSCAQSQVYSSNQTKKSGYLKHFPHSLHRARHYKKQFILCSLYKITSEIDYSTLSSMEQAGGLQHTTDA
jgi:hypothetical protein